MITTTDIAIAAWVKAEPHPTDCICDFCAPISLPTRSPMINDALAGGAGIEVAQAVALLVGLKPYGQRVAVQHLRAISGLQGKMG